MIESAIIRVKQFDAAQGGNPILSEKGWWLYENGAMRDKDVLGALISPPDDPVKRAQNIANFYRRKHQLAAEAFEKRKHVILNRMHPSEFATHKDDLIVEMRELEAKVQEARKQYDAALEQVEIEKNDGQPTNKVRNYNEATGERTYIDADVAARQKEDYDAGVDRVRDLIKAIKI